MSTAQRQQQQEGGGVTALATTANTTPTHRLVFLHDLIYSAAVANEPTGSSNEDFAVMHGIPPIAHRHFRVWGTVLSTNPAAGSLILDDGSATLPILVICEPKGAAALSSSVDRVDPAGGGAFSGAKTSGSNAIVAVGLPAPGAVIECIGMIVCLPSGQRALAASALREQNDPHFEALRWLDAVGLWRSAYALADRSSAAAVFNGAVAAATTADGECGAKSILLSEVVASEVEPPVPEAEYSTPNALLSSQFSQSQQSQEPLSELARKLEAHIRAHQQGVLRKELLDMFASEGQAALAKALLSLEAGMHIYADGDVLMAF